MKKRLTGVGHLIVMCGILASAFAAVGGPLAAKVAAKCEVKARDAWYGYDRTVFVFDGEEAWVVEPKAEKAGRPWCWTMEWPGAFAKRAASVALLAAGYHHVTLRPGEYQDGKFVSRPGNMTDRRLAKSRAFQKFLVTELGFAPKANLIGMSWGGFYSVRYAGTHPDAVAHIYLDAPLLDFSSLTGWNLKNVYKTYGITDEKYCGLNDPRQPVNMAEPIAKAGIPILLLYGGQDRVVPPAKNCKPFAERFQKAGGQIEIVCREAYAHHPHGLEIDEQDRFVAFFGKEPVRAARPVPRPALARRLADESLETYGIVHWGLNTFTDREWGFGDEDPALLNPTRFDALQIASACRAGGLGGLIVVAKHHDGFCLWPTKTTDHNISRSPFRGGKGDYVREMEQACRKTGLRFGVYVSPWDRNSAAYGSERYVKEVFQAQIRELLSGDYGEIFEMWFDGANGGDGYYGGARETRRIPLGYYRYHDATFPMVRRLQPNVCIFNESDEADFRWPGNEQGRLVPESRATTPSHDPSNYGAYLKTAISGSPTGTVFHPAEADFPLRRGWFYHERERDTVRCGEYLMQRYLDTVGNGGTMNIGVAPNREGVLAPEDVAALARFGEIRRQFFLREAKDGEPFNVIVLREDLSAGEQVDGWDFVADGKTVASGTAIGVKRIRVLGEPVRASRCEVRITKDGGDCRSVACRRYFVEPRLLNRVMNATTTNGETDTALWMTKGK